MKSKIIPLSVLLLAGCSSNVNPKPGVLEAVDASVNAVVKVYEGEQRACLKDPAPAQQDKCIAEVRERWSLARGSILIAQAAIRAAMGAK